jgi:glycosyltransferase involved in cell wall biosynthesis
MKRAMFLVMPSEWYEGFPMTIREAFACGKPVIGSRMGAMAEIITDGETGLLFAPGSVEELTEKVRWLASSEKAVQKMGQAARTEFEFKYSAKKSYRMLMDIYRTVLRNNAQCV